MIEMVRGDSETITVFRHIGCKQVPFEEGDKVYLTVKRAATDPDEEALFQKKAEVFRDGVAIFEIKPQDTKEAEFTDYIYDVQLTDKDSRVYTIVKASTFRIGEEVTHV